MFKFRIKPSTPLFENGNEEYEYFRSYYEKNPPKSAGKVEASDIACMLQLGYAPIQKTEGPSWLGSGFFGNVYEAVDQNGQYSVIKTVRLDEYKFQGLASLKQEAEMHETLIALRDSLPEEVKKHIVMTRKVHRDVPVAVDGNSEESLTYYVYELPAYRKLSTIERKILYSGRASAHKPSYVPDKQSILTQEYVDFVYDAIFLTTPTRTALTFTKGLNLPADSSRLQIYIKAYAEDLEGSDHIKSKSAITPEKLLLAAANNTTVLNAIISKYKTVVNDLVKSIRRIVLYQFKDLKGLYGDEIKKISDVIVRTYSNDESLDRLSRKENMVPLERASKSAANEIAYQVSEQFKISLENIKNLPEHEALGEVVATLILASIKDSQQLSISPQDLKLDTNAAAKKIEFYCKSALREDSINLKKEISNRITKSDNNDESQDLIFSNSYNTFADTIKLKLQLAQNKEPKIDLFSFGSTKERLDALYELGKVSQKAYSFMSAMVILGEEYGILFGDLHGDNVMADKNTGDYVAVDIGLFKNVE
jgi:hypothetical protein